MTSQARMNASRANGKNSRGPKTAAGKWMASRNALRHGLAATKHGGLIPKADIAVFAMGLCGQVNDPTLYRQAEIIAENALVLRAIERQQVMVIERLRDPSASGLSLPNRTLQQMKERARQDDRAYEALVALREALLVKYAHELPPLIPDDHCTEIDQLFPPELEELLEEKEAEQAVLEPQFADVQDARGIQVRDEGSAIEAAAEDLVRLERYERRAASRMQRAILAFVGLQESRSET